MRGYVRSAGVLTVILLVGIEQAGPALRRDHALQLLGARAHETSQVHALTAMAW